MRAGIIKILFCSLTGCVLHPLTGIDSLQNTSNQSDRVQLLVLLGQSTTGQNTTGSTADFKYLFVSASTTDGDFSDLPFPGTPVEKIDALCNTDANRPDTASTYKAVVSIAPLRRLACSTANCSGGTGEHSNWVLTADTEYRRSDGITIIGRTLATAGIFPVTVTPLQNSITDSAAQVFTGLRQDWRDDFDCQDWLTTGIAEVAIGANDTSAVNVQSIAGTNLACNTPYPVYCAEQ